MGEFVKRWGASVEEVGEDFLANLVGGGDVGGVESFEFRAKARFGESEGKDRVLSGEHRLGGCKVFGLGFDGFFAGSGLVFGGFGGF